VPVPALNDPRYIEYENSTSSAAWKGRDVELDRHPPEQAFSDRQAMLSPANITCYAIRSGAWFEVRVKFVGDQIWDEKAIEHLVLDEKVKRKIVGLVEPHRKNRSRVIGDIVASKGKVRIGPPSWRRV
jgi:hypothetical protein